MRRLSALFLTILFSVPVLADISSKPLAVIELLPHPGGTHMMTMKASVNGHEGLFMFDTGGGISYISPDFANRVGCEPWGQITGFMLTGQRLDMPRCDNVAFDVDGIHLPLASTGVFDIGKLMPPDAPHIDGSIALDAFASRTVTLSLAQKTLTLESPASLRQRVRHAQEVPIRMVREAEGLALSVVVAVPTSRGMAWMEIDSGNGGANVVGKHIAALLGLDPATKGPQAANIKIAGGISAGDSARVNETLTMDGNIGTRFLINWDLTLDLARGRAWLAKARTAG